MEHVVGRRVIIVGSSGAGKSTLGEQLATRLGVPFIELDALHWEPGWVEAEREVFRERVRQATEPDAWVMVGNYTRRQMDVSWPRADTVIWLDLPLPLILRRVSRRIWQRWRTQEDLWGTSNREAFREHLMFWNPDKSLITYTITTHRRRQRTFEAATTDPAYAHLRIIRLRSPNEVEHLLTNIGEYQLVQTS